MDSSRGVGLVYVDLVWLGAGLDAMGQGELISVGARRRCWLDLSVHHTKAIFSSSNFFKPSTGIRVYQVRALSAAKERIIITYRQDNIGRMNT